MPVIATATRFEWLVARVVCRGVPVVAIGVGARHVARLAPGALVLSVGVCGALDPDLPRGTLVIPAVVGDGSGEPVTCDLPATAALLAAAGGLGRRAAGRPMLTAPRVIGGAERAALRAGGWAAVDMETAVIGRAGHPVAAVRAVLDTPDRELPAAVRGAGAGWRRRLSVVAALGLAGPAARGTAAAAKVARHAALRLGDAAGGGVR